MENGAGRAGPRSTRRSSASARFALLGGSSGSDRAEWPRSLAGLWPLGVWDHAGIVAPDPAEDVRHDRAAVGVGVDAFGVDGGHVVPLLLQGGDHQLVLLVPVAGGVVGAGEVVEGI